MDIPRFNVLGVGVHAVNLSTATAYLIQRARDKTTGYVCCCDAHSITRARGSEHHRRTLNQALLATPDGMPLVWAGQRSGHDHVGRTYGPDLMESICAATAETELTHYFYGGGENTAADLVTKLQGRFPGLKVVGHESPPWQEDATRLATAGIVHASADFVWIGLSTPKQEAFMAHFHRQPDSRGITLGVGAAFDFLSGRVKQAPVGWQKAGFEWLWRLGQEPGRLAKRYLITVPSFGSRLLAQRLGVIKFPIDD
ncbi:MAG: WecB/TagA/CpsF family glycosyltransferase [Synoicihabitans sp.]